MQISPRWETVGVKEPCLVHVCIWETPAGNRALGLTVLMPLCSPVLPLKFRSYIAFFPEEEAHLNASIYQNDAKQMIPLTEWVWICLNAKPSYTHSKRANPVWMGIRTWNHVSFFEFWVLLPKTSVNSFSFYPSILWTYTACLTCVFFKEVACSVRAFAGTSACSQIWAKPCWISRLD